MNTGKLIKCYERNRNTLYISSYPWWLKRYFIAIIAIGYLLYSILMVYLNANGALTISIFYIVSLYVGYMRTFRLSKKLKEKYSEIYNIRLLDGIRWTENMTYKVRKTRLKNVLGSYVQNEALMTRIKAQLNDEIIRNKKTLQSPIPLSGLLTVFIGTYIAFNLKYYETKFGKLDEMTFTVGTDFLKNTLFLVATSILLVVMFKPSAESVFNSYSLRLTDLLKTIQTIEIEYYASTTGSK